MKKKYFLILIILVASGAGLMFSGVFKSAHHHKINREFMVTNPWRKDVEVTKEYVAQIRSIQHIEIRSFEKGYLQNIYVKEGQLVKKGEQMFQVMPLLMQSKLEKAKAEYEFARIEYENTRSLQQKNVVSRNELALAKAKLDKEGAEMQLAQRHLDLTMIKAPFEGLMDKLKVRLGSLVEEGELLTTLSDNSQMWVYFNVSEADYLNYRANKTDDKPTPVKLKLANGDMFKYDGSIDTIEADFDNKTGNIAFRATFPNPENLLRQGETGNVLIAENVKDALVIPQKATFEVLDKKYVYVLNKKGEIASKEIKIAQEVPHLFVVKSGLKEKDVVLLEGLGKVHVGDHIKTKIQDVAKVMEGLELSID
jgi:membrane fusion protein, multidrug efflux system